MVNTIALERLRIENDFSYEEISHRMGYAHKSSYSKKLRNKGSIFTLQDIMKLCEIFGVEPNDLLIH